MKLATLNFCIGLFFSFQAIAQSTTLDAVQTKNGTEYVGTIFEQKPGEHIKIITLLGNDTVLVYYSEIELITKVFIRDNPYSNDTTTIVSSSMDSAPLVAPQEFNQRPFTVRIGFGACGGDFGRLLLGLGVYRRILPEFNIGVKILYYTDYYGTGSLRGPGMFFPVVIDSEYEFQKIADNRLAYLVGLSAGFMHIVKGQSTHQFSSSSTVYSYSDGFIFSPSIGLRINYFKNVGMIFKLGYQGSVTKRIDYNTNTALNRLFHSNIVGSISLFF